MKRFVLVYNPISGHAVLRKKLDYMIAAFQKRGAALIPYRTKIDNAELPDFLREVNPDGVLSAGGDGTLHEVVNIVLHNKLELPIGVIPSGTSNDFACYLKVKDDQEAYFDKIVAGSTKRFDVGQVGNEYFINVASAGMFTSIAHNVDPRLKNAFGKMAYYVRGFAQMPLAKSVDITVKVNGQEYHEDAFMFVVANSDIVAGMRHIAAEARVDDGKLDLLLVKKCNLKDLVSITKELFAGKPVANRKEILYIQAEEFAISAAVPLESDLDGEKGPLLPLTIKTVPQAVSLFC